MTEEEKFIIVASNYRLGSLGWMSSDEEPGMTRNAGLYDALAALQWTRANIHWFGGDGSQITAMGESAGGGIIEHLLAASTQGYDVAFSQVIAPSLLTHCSLADSNCHRHLYLPRDIDRMSIVR